MKFEEFKKGQKVIHILRKEWGHGEVTYICSDRSVFIKFPKGPSKHKNNTNTFRYYEQGLHEVMEVKK